MLDRARVAVLFGQNVAPWKLQTAQILEVSKMSHQTQYVVTLIFTHGNQYIEKRHQHLFIVSEYNF